ncbi:MAG: squalene--hopene cyclase [Rhodospirillaceae bacterium]|nr:squalene--hopene cyclase [Rhodospirillaceae bacterium]
MDPMVRQVSFDVQLDNLINENRLHLKKQQAGDGHWIFELEADATIPAEYIMLQHFLDEPNPKIEEKIARYLRHTQEDHGGWPLFHKGDMDLSASVKAYFALKLVGDDPNTSHMRRARNAILAKGGAASANVFTRIALAIFGLLPWRAVPTMPIEIMLLPKWFPFHLDKVSYWSRTVIVPLLVLMNLKPRAKNPKRVRIDELFVIPPDKQRKYLTNTGHFLWGRLFLGLDKLLKIVEPVFPKKTRKKALQLATDWFSERLNAEDGLGAIFPAMANSVMAMEAMGYPKNNPQFVAAKKSIDKLLIIDQEKDMAYCQPCVSPVWDTALTLHTLVEAGEANHAPTIMKGLDWLKHKQITDIKGDWAVKTPDLKPGGWAFQYNNAYYPDVDDTAVVGMILDRADRHHYLEQIDIASTWIKGMQSHNGGWGAFDIDNHHYYLNHIPFSDHGALLDPPTADVSARCISFLAQLGVKKDDILMVKAMKYLKKNQEKDGSWFGRWGTNYIYGTWSVLCALNAVDEDMGQPYIQKAIDWLFARQNPDGGWGEDGASYWVERKQECKASTPSQTAWALLGLMAAGQVGHEAVEKGIKYLINCPREKGRWQEDLFTSVGFPRVFYLKYHGYARYFPLWALSRYRNLKNSNNSRSIYGM